MAVREGLVEIPLDCTDEEWAMIERKARAAGKTVDDYVIDKVLGRKRFGLGMVLAEEDRLLLERLRMMESAAALRGMRFPLWKGLRVSEAVETILFDPECVPEGTRAFVEELRSTVMENAEEAGKKKPQH